MLLHEDKLKVTSKIEVSTCNCCSKPFIDNGIFSSLKRVVGFQPTESFTHGLNGFRGMFHFDRVLFAGMRTVNDSGCLAEKEIQKSP